MAREENDEDNRSEPMLGMSKDSSKGTYSYVSREKVWDDSAGSKNKNNL